MNGDDNDSSPGQCTDLIGTDAANAYGAGGPDNRLTTVPSCCKSSFSFQDQLYDLLSLGGSHTWATLCFLNLPSPVDIRHDSGAELTSAYRNNTLLPGVPHSRGEGPSWNGYGTLRLGVPGIDVDDSGQFMLPVERWPDGYRSRTYRSCGSRG